MCGRYTLKITPTELAAYFDLPEVPDLPPRYNIAPTQPIPMVRADGHQGRHLVMVRWGFVPAWAREMSGGAPLINARLESAHEKPTFRQSFRQRRCLIPADGLYEWQRESAAKQPYVFQLPDGEPFAFAGLWDRWQSPDGQVIDSCAMLTTEANAVMTPIHHRVPVILERSAYEAWLDPAIHDPETLRGMLTPVVADRLIATPVSKKVNQVVNDDPSLLEPVAVAVDTEPRELRLFDFD
jgi:putative SOS response-associated peptidase YedK